MNEHIPVSPLNISASRSPGAHTRFSIRRMRSPLALLSQQPAACSGEIVAHSEPGAERRTGEVGWLTEAGDLVVAGRIADVAVRHGRAVLMPEIDALLQQHGAVRASRTFREHGETPTAKVIAACVTDETAASLRDWMAAQVPPHFVPDEIVPLAALPDRSDAALPLLRDIASGAAARAVVTAVTARRFRRNPAYDEPGLTALVQRSLRRGTPLSFFMFWGCGPRANAGAPDHLAIAALRDLLEAVAAAAPLQASAHIIFTDIHATNNGHAVAHYRNYFAEVQRSAAGLPVTAELESAVWDRGGLTRSAIQAFEQTPAFRARWDRFALRDRFLQQAARHSRMQDKEAAARHYYATCLLEREVLMTLFDGSVFLTYNGPEFNECFPDVPTLYVYPGPRGRNDKPWFVHREEPVPQIAAE